MTERTSHTVTFPAAGDLPETSASCRCPIGADHTVGAEPPREAPMKPTELHYLRWEHDGDTVRARFTCMGDSTDSCHYYAMTEESPSTRNDECVGVSWFENVAAQELYDGPDRERVRSGPITLTVGHDDGLSWSYATDGVPDLERLEELAGRYLTAHLLGQELDDREAPVVLARAVPALVAIVRALAGVA